MSKRRKPVNKTSKTHSQEEIMQWNNLNFDLIKKGAYDSEKAPKKIRRIYVAFHRSDTLKIFEGTNFFFISFGNPKIGSS